jgi:sulfatase maturation enzyme AslB (radical SAM superfamily)
MASGLGSSGNLVQIVPPSHPGDPPRVDLESLDVLWFQVAGTLCNLTCTHCFVSSSPSNRSFEMMERAQVERLLEESARFGVREFYFTGGEPFAHPEMVEILESALHHGPTTVLTNGTLFRPDRVERLARASSSSHYSLEIRVSIDGFTAADHDALRGAGSFERAMAGLDLLVAHGFLPIVTATRTWPLDRDDEVFQGFEAMLKARGYARPRIKLIPALRIGAEALRAGGYEASDFVTQEMMRGYDVEQLICRSARVATSRGFYVCPILLDSPDARLGDTLEEAVARPYFLRHQACTTCYMHGAICSNPSLGHRATAG